MLVLDNVVEVMYFIFCSFDPSEQTRFVVKIKLSLKVNWTVEEIWVAKVTAGM